jgi:hypothetical protein
MNFNLENFYKNNDPSVTSSTSSPNNDDDNEKPQYDIIIRERTTAKDKRREVVRNCETKRRKKLKDLMEELKQIVAPNEDKITQQDILWEAVQRLREMQTKLDERSQSDLNLPGK